MPYRDPKDRTHYQSKYDRKRRSSHRAVKVTLTWEQYRQFEKVALSEQTSVPRLLASLAESKLLDAPFLDHATQEKITDIIRLLRNSGNSINQIAHACNLGMYGQSDGEQLLTQIHEGLVQMEVFVKKSLTDS
jgi:hypothetical protein